MTARVFAYWLQGYFEIHGKADLLTPQQTEMIKRHLAIVFKHEIDPSFGDTEKQAALNQLHDLSHDSPLFDVQGTPLIRC